MTTTNEGGGKRRSEDAGEESVKLPRTARSLREEGWGALKRGDIKRVEVLRRELVARKADAMAHVAALNVDPTLLTELFRCYNCNLLMVDDEPCFVRCRTKVPNGYNTRPCCEPCTRWCPSCKRSYPLNDAPEHAECVGHCNVHGMYYAPQVCGLSCCCYVHRPRPSTQTTLIARYTAKTVARRTLRSIAILMITTLIAINPLKRMKMIFSFMYSVLLDRIAH